MTVTIKQISIKTFFWKNKINNKFEIMKKNILLYGVVEHETLIIILTITTTVIIRHKIKAHVGCKKI